MPIVGVSCAIKARLERISSILNIQFILCLAAIALEDEVSGHEKCGRTCNGLACARPITNQLVNKNVNFVIN